MGKILKLIKFFKQKKNYIEFYELSVKTPRAKT